MLNINTIIITGRLVKDAEVKSAGERNFATYTIANTWYNAKRSAEDGTVTYEPHTDFYDCVENIGNVEAYSKKLDTLKKGHETHVLGKLVKKTVKKDDSSTTFYSVRVVKSSLNYACFEGRVVADGQKFASKKEDSSGFCRFRIASNGLNYKNANGEWVSKTAFIDVRMNVYNYEKFIVPAKGDAVMVEGYFITEEYTTKEGENRSQLILVAEPDTYAITRKDKPAETAKAAPANSTQGNMLDDFEDDIPF